MTALDDYGPFDAGIGASRTESFWSDFFKQAPGGTGVLVGIGSELAVVQRAAGANLSVDVGTGECFVRGHWGKSTSVKNLAIAAAHATLARIDRIAARVDFDANTVSVEVLTGTAAGSPAAPTLTRSSSVWEFPLAQISVPATDTTIGTAQITDERPLRLRDGVTAYPSTAARDLDLTAPAPGDQAYIVGTGRVEYNGSAWVAVGGGGSVPSARARRTAGDITANSTSWANVDTGTDLVLAAVAGDVVAVSVSALWGNSAVEGYLDVHTWAAGAAVNSVSGGAVGGTTEGVMAWWGQSSRYDPVGGTVQYVVQAGDLSGGNVTLRLRYRTSTATNKSLLANANDPLQFSAMNLRH